MKRKRERWRCKGERKEVIKRKRGREEREEVKRKGQKRKRDK